MKIMWWPAEIQEFEKNLATAFQAFTADVNAHQGVLTSSEFAGYQALYRRYVDWHNGLTIFAWTSIATVRVLQSYAGQLQYWIDIYNGRSPEKSTGPGTSLLLPPESRSSTPQEYYERLALYAVVSVGLVAVAKIVRG
jgi:hypothetical protein